MKLKKYLFFIIGTLISALAYVVLSESYTLVSFGIGAILGLVSMFVCVLFFSSEFLSRYDVKLVRLLWYLICLLFIIIISGFKSIIIGFSKSSTSLLVTYESSLESDMLVTLLANSITLTPGTTTIDKNGTTLKVMRLCKIGDEKDLSDITKLESMIKKTQRSKA